MEDIVKIKVDDDLTFLVEVRYDNVPSISNEMQDLQLPPGATPTGRFSDSMKEMSNTILAVIKYVQDGFNKASHPDEMTIEFSITLKGSSGIPVVASGSAEGTFKISATWKNRNKA